MSQLSPNHYKSKSVMLSLALLAGGDSGRMRQGKALMPFLGRPLILRILERLAPLADEIILTTDRPADYAFLGLPLHPDLEPGRGALGRLYTSLSVAKNHWWRRLATCLSPAFLCSSMNLS